MAVNNSPPLLSPSESDSDGEPNSRGARVFWGNLKTPEKTQFALVDPPKTVVRTRRGSHTHITPDPGMFSVSGKTSMSSNNISEDVKDFGQALDSAHLNNPTMSKVEQGHDVEYSHSQGPLNAQANGSESQPSHSQIDFQTTSSQVAALNVSVLGTCPESRIEGGTVLPPSTSADSSPLPHYIKHSQMSDTPSRHPPSAIASAESPRIEAPPSLTIEPPALHPSGPPDLISLEMSNPLPLDASGPQPASSPALETCNRPQPSMCATVESLLPISHARPKSPSRPLPPLSQCPNPRVQSDNAIHNANPGVTPHADGLPSCDVRESPAAVFTVLDIVSPQATLFSNDTSGTLPQDNSSEPWAVHGTITEEGPLPKLPDEPFPHTPKPIRRSPSTSGAETRKRSPIKGPKANKETHNCDDRPTMSSTNTYSTSFNPSANDIDDPGDKTAKKERRAKMKREAECARQQLLSLSPTSADVLNRLASPIRDSPTMPLSPLGHRGALSNIAIQSDLPSRSPYVDLATPQMPAAHRVPVPTSPRHCEGSQIRLDPPGLVSDPCRTPAPRVFVGSGSRGDLPPLSLGDPNRTPARRVALLSSPARRVERTKLAGPRISLGNSSPIKQALESPTRSPMFTSSKLHDGNNKSSSSASFSTTIRAAELSPFPVRHKQAGSDRDMTSSVRSSHLTPDGYPSNPPLTSNLRHLSPFSTSRIARITAKPSLRPIQETSRLPIAPSLRRAVPIVGASSGSKIAGPSHPHPSSTHFAPSRIPSPIKRRAPSSEPPSDASITVSASTGTNIADVNACETTHNRKRRRMAMEDDSDEPPAKRSVIMVRPVVKGMYSYASSANSKATESSTTQQGPSPVCPSRPPAPIQVRRVVSGALPRFETAKSSPRDFFRNTEHGDSLSAAPVPSVTVPGLPSVSREETLHVVNDTVFTLNTLSRESTLEDFSELSTPALSSMTQVPTASGPKLRRTTRVPKTYGRGTLLRPNASAVTRHDPRSFTRTTTMAQQGGSLLSKTSTRSFSRSDAPLEALPLNPRRLQALTDANTLRNQTYMTDLQRKVVRRNGPRPVSPTTKVRTVMEKSKQERSKEREVRAERRRRRDQGSDITASSEGEYMDMVSSPTPDGQVSDNPPPRKHARGPGDEREYETPVRAAKPSRLDAKKIVKTVKWDRGLARTISDLSTEQIIDDTYETAAEAKRKGCLIRDPAKRPLDPLGNVPDADTPLENLERERVIITRFVYDDDVEATRAAKKKRS